MTKEDDRIFQLVLDKCKVSIVSNMDGYYTLRTSKSVVSIQTNGYNLKASLYKLMKVIGELNEIWD